MSGFVENGFKGVFVAMLVDVFLVVNNNVEIFEIPARVTPKFMVIM